MAQHEKDIYRVVITRTHEGYFDGVELKFPYRVDVTRLAFKSGKTWSDYDLAMTKWGARRAAKKIIKKNSKQVFRPEVVDKYELNA